MDILLTRAQRQISEDFPELEISDLHLVGRGPVFTVIKGKTKNNRPVGIRIAPEHWIEADTHHRGQKTDHARDLLLQECLLSTHCRAHGLPAPEIIGQSHRVNHKDGLDLFIYEWLADDGKPPETYHIGNVLHRLHTMNPPAFIPVAMREGSFEKVLTHRILNTAGAVTRMTNRPFTLPDSTVLQAHLSWPDKRTSLLHMDFRPANLHTYNGKISGVMGWCAALIGPPTLELVQLDELDILDDSFLGGYDNYEMFKAPKPVETAFRLDAATRQAKALLLDSPGSDETLKAVNRVAFLFTEFASMSDR